MPFKGVGEAPGFRPVIGGQGLGKLVFEVLASAVAEFLQNLVQGLENVIPAMNRLLTGANTGKVFVKLAT